NNKRYMPFTLTDGETCHCSNWRGQEKLAPGGNIDIWAAFPSPPESVELVAVTTPATPDFLDIPITEATSPDSAIVDTPTSEPRVLDLRAFQDDMDGNSSRTESAEETSIMLSSDVLFGLNEATLTEAAEEALRNVAEEINSSSGTTIQVNGYTDDTGSDSINNPLSQKRAEAVASRLEELVTRDGITFEVSGHGSADPVGDNSTEEGRAKNRRVTVTFTK
ncbi:OmpA family protein, partial [Thermobifida halotolerans]